MREAVLPPVTVPCEALGLFDSADTVEVTCTVHLYEDADWDIDAVRSGSRDLTTLVPDALWVGVRKFLTPHVKKALAAWIGEELEQRERDEKWRNHLEGLRLDQHTEREEQRWNLDL